MYYCIVRTLLITLVFPVAVVSQPLVPTLLTSFPDELNEVSGILVLEDAVWVMLDSGNPNAIHRVDPMTGSVLRTVTLDGVTNTDWEEMTTDGTWVFVGDFGNNAGARTDLRIHRFPVSALLDEGASSVPVGTIHFSYLDQVDFTPAMDATEWDCEAFIATGDSLFLFTKNWVDRTTHLYGLPAIPGNHQAIPRGSMDTQGLITGAAYDPNSGTIALIGHELDEQPFVWQLSGYMEHSFFSATAIRRPIALTATQVEAIAWTAPDTVQFACERNMHGSARLWEMPLDLDMRITKEAPFIRPTLHTDPVGSTLQLNHLHGPAKVRIIDMTGQTVLVAAIRDGQPVFVDALPNGQYVLEVIQQDRSERLPFVHVH